MVEKPLLLFDMDGTLILLQEDSRHPELSTSYASYVSLRQQMKDIAASYGVPIDEFEGLNRMAHIWNKTRAYAESFDFDDSETKALMMAINEPFTQEESADHARSVSMPDAIEALETLHNKGYTLGIVTTASRGAYERLSNSSEFGCFGKYFSFSITRDDCNYIKPDPEPIFRILDLFGRSDFIYIGDSDHDAIATKAAGGKFVLINTRKYDDTTIKMLRPYAVINNLFELSEVL